MVVSLVRVMVGTVGQSDGAVGCMRLIHTSHLALVSVEVHLVQRKVLGVCGEQAWKYPLSFHPRFVCVPVPVQEAVRTRRMRVKVQVEHWRRCALVGEVGQQASGGKDLGV
jgi:hypothetical protein